MSVTLSHTNCGGALGAGFGGEGRIAQGLLLLRRLVVADGGAFVLTDGGGGGGKMTDDVMEEIAGSVTLCRVGDVKASRGGGRWWRSRGWIMFLGN